MAPGNGTRSQLASRSEPVGAPREVIRAVRQAAAPDQAVSHQGTQHPAGQLGAHAGTGGQLPGAQPVIISVTAPVAAQLGQHTAPGSGERHTPFIGLEG